MVHDCLFIYRVAENKIPHRRICNISATNGLIGCGDIAYSPVGYFILSHPVYRSWPPYLVVVPLSTTWGRGW